MTEKRILYNILNKSYFINKKLIYFNFINFLFIFNYHIKLIFLII
jgi:hypothetical protein